jgi:enamine deaminase RidA (YjgF/YER057c/UK114 family)
MINRAHNPSGVFEPYVNYAHAVEVPAGARTLYISGLNGYERDGTTMPTSFDGQATLIWQHLARVLASADMTYADLVSLRFYLADPAFDAANVVLLMSHLGEHRAADSRVHSTTRTRMAHRGRGDRGKNLSTPNDCQPISSLTSTQVGHRRIRATVA